MFDSSRLIIRLIEESDDEIIVRWRNYKHICDNMFSSSVITLKEHRNWFESYVKSGTRMEFMIIVKAIDKRIGTIGLSNIDSLNQKAEYGIIIGESEHLGKGYAKEASKLIIDYGFKELNLQKISLRVFDNNTTALKLYSSLGFVEEGTLRREFIKNGEFKNVIIMSILEDEWH